MATVAIGQTAMMVTDSCRVRRTEAMPKASLFGSILEIQDKEGANSLQALDPRSTKVPKTPTGKGPGQKFSLPEDIKQQLPGAAVLEKSKREFESQRNKLNEHSDELRKREEESLFKFSRGGEQASARQEPGTARSPWFSEQDLKGAKDINILGLNERQSYNRDKYGRKPQVHNYTNIGDPLRPGMDFPRRERTEIQMRNSGYGMGDKRGVLASSALPPQTQAPVSARCPRTTAIDVPPNIKHQYGSRVCDKLLSDKGVVEKTIRDQAELKESIQRRSKPVKVPPFTKELNPDYEMLSNAMRMNIVPGYTMNHKTTTTKSVYTDQVHLFRHQDPDKWRYQKDDLSKWAEHNVLRQRMTKAWEQYFIETVQKKNQPN